MEDCSHIWAGAPNCYLELLDKLQKWICRIAGPSFAASLEPLTHHQNAAASLSLFYRYYFGRSSSELAKLIPLPSFLFDWDSPHARLNSHYNAWSCKKKKHIKVDKYRKSL